MQYTQDYDERMPPYKAAGISYWPDLLTPYIKSDALLRCPDSPSLKSGGDYTKSTYGLAADGRAGNNRLAPYTNRGTHLAEFTQPSISWMLVETRYDFGTGTSCSAGNRYSGCGWGTADSLLYGSSGTPPGPWYTRGSTQFDYDRHLEGSNVGYVDGHVKWVKYGSDVSSQIWKGL